MSFLNLSLLFGGLFTAIPVVLHLIMRQQPKRLVFPALQFLRERRETNRQQLQLRHWLLLALRCAALVVLALAFARPSVLSAAVGSWGGIVLLGSALLLVGGLDLVAYVQKRGRVIVAALNALALLLLTALGVLLAATVVGDRGGLLGDEKAPVAAVIICDTAPRMEYRHRNQTRLEKAREMAEWLLAQFPEDSDVAVLDARPAPPVFAIDAAAAKKALARLRMTEVAEPLPEVIRRALPLLLSNDKSRREIYVLTDQSAAAWPETAGSISELLRQHPDVSIYVIDVGVDEPRNAALGTPQLSAERLTRTSELRVTCEVRNVGLAGEFEASLYLEEPDLTLPMIVDGQPHLPTARRRAQQALNLAAGESQQVDFQIRGFEPGVHHGYIQLTGGDGLDVDNQRHFTIEVTDAWPVLVVAPANATPLLFTEAIAPFEFRQTGQARFDCTTVAQSSLANRELDSYAAVCLLDPEPIPSVVWEQLGSYARRGGGLAIFLGHNAQVTASFNDVAAQELLAGKLSRVWRAPDRDVYLAPDRYEHPLLTPFRDNATSVPWNAAPVWRHWGLNPLNDGATTIVKLSNGEPALLERSTGAGRVLTMTTPVSDSLRPAGREPWNELPTSEEAWPYVVLVNELLQYLTDSVTTRLNYLVGETAVLANDPQQQPERYQLFTPREQPQEVRAHEGQLVVRFTEHTGAYRLKGVRDGPVIRGFATNLPPEATDLTRLPREKLEERLGPGRAKFARSQEEITFEVGEARVGREFYAHLVVLLAVVLGVEQLLSNRFYRKAE